MTKRCKQAFLRLFLLLIFTVNINTSKASTDPLDVLDNDVIAHLSGFLSETDLTKCSEVSNKWRATFSLDVVWQPIAKAHYQSLVRSDISHYISQSETAKKIEARLYRRLAAHSSPTADLKLNVYPVYKYLRLLAPVIVQEVSQKAMRTWSDDLAQIVAIDEGMRLF